MNHSRLGICSNWQEIPAKRAFVLIFLAKYWQETDFSKKSSRATPSEKLEIRSYLLFVKIWLFSAPYVRPRHLTLQGQRNKCMGKRFLRFLSNPTLLSPRKPFVTCACQRRGPFIDGPFMFQRSHRTFRIRCMSAFAPRAGVGPI